VSRIGLVSCSSEKLDHAAPARELYCSSLFRLALRYAEQTCERVYVLSGLHYLVQLDEMIAPYDFHLGKQPRARREAWGYHVAWQLAQRHPERGELVILAGAAYADALQTTGARETWQWSFPLAGLQLGERLRFLSNATKKGTDSDGNS
jgi:uncharacterized protein DUF6884